MGRQVTFFVPDGHEDDALVATSDLGDRVHVMRAFDTTVVVLVETRTRDRDPATTLVMTFSNAEWEKFHTAVPYDVRRSV